MDKLEENTYVKPTKEILRHIQDRRSPARYPHLFNNNTYSIVKGPMDNDQTERGLRHMVQWFNEDYYIESFPVHSSTLDEYNRYKIDSIISNLELLEQRHEEKGS